LGSFVLLPLSQAVAVLIAGPDGTTNTTAPISEDPGFANVGRISGLSGVYVRNGWVLTAAHVGIGPIELDGSTYQPVPDSDTRFTNSPGGVAADLIAFKLQQRPPLPDLALASGPVYLNDEVIMIGRGMGRGDPTTWTNFGGWNLTSTREIRWGTNRVAFVEELVLSTYSFGTEFDDLPWPSQDDPEAQAVDGDSGGAAFRWNGASSELVGILFARGLYLNQPTNTALFGNESTIVDLDYYRPQILALIDQPDCDDGLDDDGDGWIDFPEDDGCEDALDPSEVPEPGFGVALAAGVLGLGVLARRRGRDRRSSYRRQGWIGHSCGASLNRRSLPDREALC
jgi:hypothetical protein